MNAYGIQNIKFTGPLAFAIVSLPFSVFFCHLSLAVLGLSWVTDGKWNEKWSQLRSNPMVIGFLLLFLLHLSGILYSDDKQAAWFDVEKKFFLLVVPVVLATIELDKRTIRLLFKLFVLACLAAAVICVIAAVMKLAQSQPVFNFDPYSASSFYRTNPGVVNAWMYFSYIELAAGVGMHPTYLSLYLVFCVLLLIHFYAEKYASYTLTKKIGVLLLLIYLSLFILCLSSRIVTLCFLCIGIYGIYQFLASTPSWVKVVISVLFAGSFISFVYINPVSRFRDYQEISETWPYLKQGLQTQSTTIRASLWTLSVKSIPDINWLIGAGTGDVEALIRKAGDRWNMHNILGTYDPHNQYLQTFLGLGALGLLTLVACLGLPAWTAYHTKDYFYLWFAFLFAALCFTETALELQKGIAFFALFNSLLLFQYKRIIQACNIMKHPVDHTELSRSVLKTLLYFDIFHYPLTAGEVFSHLQTNHVTEKDVENELTKMKALHTVHSFDQFYSVQNDASLEVRRKQGNRVASHGLKLAVEKARLISRFPFVRAVMASGSLSKGYMDERSDLDFFVIAEPGRLWIARMLLIIYKRIFLFNSHKHFCINYYVDSAHLEIEEKNLFTATELATLVPLYGKDFYQKLFEANRWIKDFLPNTSIHPAENISNSQAGAIKRAVEKCISFMSGDALDRFFMKLTQNRWKRLYQDHYDAADFEIAFKSKPHTSKNHLNHYQKKILGLYREKLSDYENRFGINLQ